MQVILHPTLPVMLMPSVPDVDAALHHIPGSRVVEKDGTLFVAAPHNSSTVRVARNLGIDAPSSLSTRYGWPGMFPPFDHQRVTTEFMTLHPRCLNLSDMGTGKTASAIWAADHLMNEGALQRVLIMSTLSCMHTVWEQEVFQVAPHRASRVLYATRAKRRRLAEESTADFLILNHDGMGVVHDILMKRKDIDLIIFDEASALKNGQTDRFKMVVKLLNRWRCSLWLLTGTPTPNAPTDAWALGRLVNKYDAETNPTGVQRSFVKFRDSCMRQVTPYKWQARPNAQVIVRTALQPAIRFNKDECIDLPPVTHTNREARMTAEQNAAYKEMKSKLVTAASTAKGQGVTVTAINAAAKLTKLLQICNGAVYSDDGRIGTLDMAPRLEVLEEVIEQAGKKVLVFVPYRNAIERVHEHLIDAGITCDVMHGGITGKARADVITRFMRNPDPKVLIAHPRTASHGLNLTCADVAVWFGPTFSAEQYQQANERMARPGQDSHMTIVHIHSAPVERRAFALLADKQSMQKGILSLYEEEVST